MISIRSVTCRRISLPILLIATLLSVSFSSHTRAMARSPSKSGKSDKSDKSELTAASPQEASPGQGGSQAITKLLSPTALNIFDFGPHRFKVQYPPKGPGFSGVYMTVTAVQISQTSFSRRVSGTSFAKAVCVVYTGETGNCIDYEVTCSNASGQVIQCPTSTSPYISFWTSYDTEQPIVNPGLLTTPIGANSWQNVLDWFFLTRIDPTAHGHTKGWSEFVSVALGTTNGQGLGEFAFNPPLQTLDPKSFPVGQPIPVSFQLTSVVNNCGQPVTDAVASLSVLKVADSQGHAVSQIVYYRQNAFKYSGGSYEFSLPTTSFAAGTYVLTVYGDAFVSQETYFTIQ
jgi:hypothetical protein